MRKNLHISKINSTFARNYYKYNNYKYNNYDSIP